MTTPAYQQLALRTAVQLCTAKDDFVHGALGLASELREYRDAPDQRGRIEELGDLCWFIALCGQAVSLDPFIAPAEASFEPLPARIDSDQATEQLDVVIAFLVDCAKAWHAYRKAPSLERVEGCLWRAVNLVEALAAMDDRSLVDLQEANIRKLRVRFPEKFEQARALTRDIDAEQDALGGE